MVNCGRRVCFARGTQALSRLHYLNLEFTLHNLLFSCSLAFNQFRKGRSMEYTGGFSEARARKWMKGLKQDGA